MLQSVLYVRVRVYITNLLTNPTHWLGSSICMQQGPMSLRKEMGILATVKREITLYWTGITIGLIEITPSP